MCVNDERVPHLCKSAPDTKKRSSATYCFLGLLILYKFISMSMRWMTGKSLLALPSSVPQQGNVKLSSWRVCFSLFSVQRRVSSWSTTSPTTRALRIWRIGSAWWRRPTRNLMSGPSSLWLGTKVRIKHIYIKQTYTHIHPSFQCGRIRNVSMTISLIINVTWT